MTGMLDRLQSAAASLVEKFSGSSRPSGCAQGEVEIEDEFAWMLPPRDPRDAVAWDEYWRQHHAHGLGPPLFDMLFDDRELVGVMQRDGLRRVLCAGNGFSLEPRALAAAGSEVVAVDLSAYALEIAETYPTQNVPLQRYFDPEARRPGGSVRFVVGDLLDAALEPGPFDVIIERSTAQTYADEDRPVFLSALAARLTPEGIFVSHCHDNTWRPGRKRRHVTGEWFKENHWASWSGGSGRKPQGRVAWLVSSTG